MVVAAFNEQGDEASIPLTVAGEKRLALRVRYLCSWDSSGAFLAIAKSAFMVPHPLLFVPDATG
ncbi:MAG: hypothetical protein ACRD0K_01725 [Egibacteraceae bacterium]